MREIETDSIHEINVFLQINILLFFFNLVPNSSIFTETTATWTEQVIFGVFPL